MACCGGSVRPQRIRKQQVGDISAQTVATAPKTMHKRIGHAATPAAQQRQHIIPRQQCTKCGYPGMIVNIAGRERMQCSNVNCRVVFG